jgi:DNA-binding IclR family transcriptional regulator
MHIGKDELLAGVPAKLRDTLIKMDNSAWSRKWLQQQLKLRPQQTKDIVAGLVTAGYIEPDRAKGWFRSGPAAPRLAQRAKRRQL